MIPAHLLGNMWAQEWDNIYDIVAPTSVPSTYDLEAALKRQIPNATSTDRGQQLEAAKALARYGDSFYMSLGFDALPETFYQRSQFIRPRDRDVECHASALDMDANLDLRIKMCIHIDADNFVTVHHEEAHNEYQRAYRNLPFLFRNGANDGFHEAIGDSIALAITPEYLKQLHLIDTIPPPEADIPLQLRAALDKVAFLPFGLLIDKWRWQVFSGQTKPPDYNRTWWALREHYQGGGPTRPSHRGRLRPRRQSPHPRQRSLRPVLSGENLPVPVLQGHVRSRWLQRTAEPVQLFWLESCRSQTASYARNGGLATLADHPETNDRRGPSGRQATDRVFPTLVFLA